MTNIISKITGTTNLAHNIFFVCAISLIVISFCAVVGHMISNPEVVTNASFGLIDK